MGYRKIVVDNKEYRFVIGKQYTKIQGHGIDKLISNESIGRHYHDTVVVRPENVAGYIRYGDKYKPKVFTCEDHGTKTTELAIDPLMNEIYYKKYLVPKCEQCLDRTAEEI